MSALIQLKEEKPSQKRLNNVQLYFNDRIHTNKNILGIHKNFYFFLKFQYYKRE